MTIFAAGVASPYVLFIIFPCFLLFVFTVIVFLASSRVLRRLDGTTRSPVFGLFGIVYSGLHTIRSFSNTKMMLERGLHMIDVNTRISIMYDVVSRWLAFRLDMIALVLVTATGVFCVVLAHYNLVFSPSAGMCCIEYV